MSNFDFTDLILLVGTNPLPNYVVGKYFLGEKDKGNCAVERIWLVYTGQTKKYADNLEKEFKFKVVVEKKSLSNEASAFKIQKDFEAGVLANLKGKTIHLNYTGGTKSMSVHTYITTLKQSIENEFGIKASYSYLNARGFNIYRDDDDNLITGDLRKEIDLSFKTLLDLHGYIKVNPDDKFKSSLFLVLKEFDTILQTNKLEDINFSKIVRIKSSGKLIEKVEEFTELIDDLTPIQKAILSKLPDNMKIYSIDGKPNKSLNNEVVKYITSFLDSKWLELYVEYTINHLKKSLKTEANYEIRDPDWSPAKNPNGSYKIQFELDVLCLNGYQFIGVSCTKSNVRAVCKSKGFEIIHRSKQIGGDEAKCILVSNLKVPDPKTKTDEDISPEDLQKELDTDTGGIGNILVLGSNDLKPNVLAKKIEDFIKK